MNYPIVKYHPDHAEPVIVRDMVQNAMLGPEWTEREPEPEVRRKPGRPKKEE